MDGVPLEGTDTYRFFLMKWNDFLTYTGSSPYPTEEINGSDSEPIYTAGKLIPMSNLSFQIEGSNYLVTLPISESLGIAYSNNYVLLVRGKDQSGNKLIPDLTKVNGGSYGFYFVENGKAPEVYVTKIKGSDSGHETNGTGTDPDPNKKNITERVYLKKADGMVVTVHIGGGGSNQSLQYELKGTVGGDVTQTDIPVVSNTITIPSGKFDQNVEKTYTLTVRATASTGNSLLQTYYIVYDVKEPEADITTLVNNAVINETNGTAFSVSGTAFDTGIGLENVSVKLSKIDGNGTFTDRALTVTTADGRWSTEAIDLSVVSDTDPKKNYGEGKYTLTMTATDKLGWKKSITRTFYFDKKAPEITNLKVNGESVVNGGTVYTNTTPVVVTGNVTESYGIETFTINGDGSGLPSTTGTVNKTLNLTEGRYSNVAIVLVDKAGQSAPDFKFDLVVDTTAPVFETSTSAAPADQIQFAGKPASGVSGAAAILTSNNPLEVTGLIKGPVSGIKKVLYVVTEKTVTTAPSTGWQQLNGTPDSNGNYRLSGFVQADGEKKVWIKAVDNAGNETVFSHGVKVVPAAVITWTLELENGASLNDTVKYNAGTWYAKGQFKVKIGGTLSTAPNTGSAMTVDITKGGSPVNKTDFFDSWTVPKILPPSSPNTYTYTVKSGQTEGEYTIKISAQGQDKLLTFTIDGTAPTVVRVEPATDSVGQLCPVFRASISDSAGIKAGTTKVHYKKVGGAAFIDNLLIKASDGSYRFTPASNMEEGTYELYFSAEDNLGNKATTKPTPPTPLQKITIDTASPELADVKVNNKAESTVYIKQGDPDVSITGKATDTNGVDKVEILKGSTVIKNAASIPSSGEWTITLNGSDALADGTHNLTIRATDKAGKIVEVQRTVVVDRGAPTLSVTKLGTTSISGNNFATFSNGYVAEGGLFIEGTATDAAAGASGIDFVRYRFNDGANDIGTVRSLDLNASGTFSQTIQVPAAAKKLKLICVDKVGNEQPITIELKVDSKAPNQPVIIDVNGKGNTPTIIVSGKEAAGITIKGSISDDSTGGVGTFSGIKEIRWTLDTASNTATPNSGVDPNTWEFTIPKASIKGGSVIITATDNVGYTSAPAVVTFLQDTESPTAKITNFDAHTAQTGIILVKGSVTDQGTAGVLPNKTQWKIVKRSDGVPTVENPGGSWTDVNNSTVGTWEITSLNLETYFKDEGGGKYSSEYTSETGILTDSLFHLPLYLWVEDASENKAVITLSILVDPAGDKPVVTIISPLSPDSSQTQPLSVGGQISIYGSAKVKEGSIGKVYMDVATTANFAAGTFVSDWENKEIDGTENWNTVLNKNNEINNLITDPDRTKIIYYRVRAMNGNGSNKLGGYSAVQKLLFDKGAPVIQDAKFHKDGNTTGTNYKEKEWITDDDDYLTFSMSDETGIKKIRITTTVNGNPTETTLEGKSAIENYKIDGQKVFTAGTAHLSYNDYTAKFPFKTSALSDLGGEYSITITVTEGTATGTTFLTQTATYTFNFDKKEPSGCIGEYVDAGNSVFSGTTLPSILNNAKIGQYLYVNKQQVKIVEDSTPGTKKLSQPVNGKFDWVLYKDRDYFTESSAIIRGIAYDEGTSGVAKITGSIKQGGTTVTGTDFTVLKGTFKKPIGDFITWEKSVPIPPTQADGKYTLAYTVEDGNGNKSTELEHFIYIKRKGIRISKVSLGTDLNRSNAVETGTDEVVAFTEMEGEKADGTVTPQQDERTFDWSGEIDASSFVFKRTDSTNAIGTITVEYTGGNAPIKYTLKTGSTMIKNNQSLPANKIIPLTQAEFALIGTGEVVLDLELTDNCGWKAFEKITARVDTTDGVKPKGGVLPLFWNDTGANKNSVVWNGTVAEGHISYEGYNTTPAASTPTWTNKPAVSGKIIVSGYAYDETLLKQVTVTVKKDSTTVNATSTFKNDGTDKWISGTAAGLSLKVTTQKLNQTGHYAFWELTWDTATIPNSVGSDIQVSVTAADASNSQGSTNKIKVISGTATRGGSSTDLTIAELDNADADMIKEGQTVRLYSSDSDAYYVYIKTKAAVKIKDNDTKKKLMLGLSDSVDNAITKYQIYTNTDKSDAEDIKFKKVDVVPYVTALKRPDTYNTHRSSSGAYNLLRGDTVTVEGFNLTGTVKATIPGEANAQTVSGGTFPLPATAKSGKVKITAGGVEAINNLTNNGKPYNRQEIANRPETQYWTDDIEVHVWKDDEQFEGSENPKYPSMAMMSNGTLYAAFSNYSTSRVYYSGINESATEIFAAYDPPEEAAISISDANKINVLYSANYHGGSSSHWNASFYDAGGLYCYDSNAGYFYNDYRHYGKAYRFELFYHNKQLQQFKNFRIARKSDRIHIAYYDSLANSIKYSSVDASSPASGDFTNDRHEIAWVDLDGGNDVDTKTDGNLKRIGTVAKLVDGAGGQFETISRTGGTAEYCAIALDGSNRPVVVYADVDSGTLRLARASSAVPTAVSDWKVQKVLTADKDPNIGIAEGYFTAKFDSEGKLHIAFRNTRGQLCYVKSTNANAGASAYTFGKSVIIDEAGSLADLSLDGTTPYISYMSRVNAFDGIRIARYDDNLVTEWNDNGTAKTKGAWNVMTAGMKNRASNVRTCIAVAPSTVTAWKAAVGYTPGNVYRVVKYIGE